MDSVILATIEEHRCTDFDELLNMRLVSRAYKDTIDHIIRTTAHKHGIKHSDMDMKSLIKKLKDEVLYRVVFDEEGKKYKPVYYLPSESVLVGCNVLYRMYNGDGYVADLTIKVTQGGKEVEYYDITEVHDEFAFEDMNPEQKSSLMMIDSIMEAYIPKNSGKKCIIQHVQDKFLAIREPI